MGTTLGYDANGNLTSYGTDLYAFDYRNRLASSTTSGINTTYGYDHSIQRVSRTANGITTAYPNSFFTKANATTTKSIYAGGELVATVEGNGTATSTHFVHSDHLGSTNVVTSSEGDVVQVLDYLPFGEKRISTGEDVSQREFLAQVEDPSTSMNYLNNRYLQSDRGQFISQDPMFWALPAQLLLDPQQQNSYSYARNNPISMSDPSGLLTIAVHGNKGSNKKGSDWYDSKSGQKFLSNVSKAFGEKAVAFSWSGDNSRSAKNAAARDLANLVDNHDFAEGEKLNIVGYSHGGNVAIRYSNMSGRNIDNLVTLGTPVRSQYQPNYDRVKNHVNMYSNADGVQPFGGTNGYALIGAALFKGAPGWILGNSLANGAFSGFEFGTAGRTYTGATNINSTFNTLNADPTLIHDNQATNFMWGASLK